MRERTVCRATMGFFFLSRASSAKWRVAGVPLAATAEAPASLSCHLEPVITEIAEAAKLHAGAWSRPSSMRRVAA